MLFYIHLSHTNKRAQIIAMFKIISVSISCFPHRYNHANFITNGVIALIKQNWRNDNFVGMWSHSKLLLLSIITVVRRYFGWIHARYVAGRVASIYIMLLKANGAFLPIKLYFRISTIVSNNSFCLGVVVINSSKL